MRHNVVESSNENVFKHVFEKSDAVYEAVVYRYGSFEKRTVICCSTQSGCKVGCVFCGTGKQFVRDLTRAEIVEQVETVMRHHKIESEGVEKFQIMFMSMGEPLHNITEVVAAIRQLHKMYPKADLLVSTVGINDNKAWRALCDVSIEIHKVGLQFSIHASTDEARRKIIPHRDVMDIRKMRLYGVIWSKITRRKVYLNYCVNGNNCGAQEAERLMDLFDQSSFAFTFSVICSKNETMKDAGYRDLDKIVKFDEIFLENGYDTRIFDPAGQDDIGGGCGQLWFVQNWMKKNPDKIQKGVN